MVVLLFLLITAYSIVMFALVRDQGFNILLATIFHLAINVGNLLFLDIIYETPLMVINASIWAILAAIVMMRQPSIFLVSRREMTEYAVSLRAERLPE